MGKKSCELEAAQCGGSRPCVVGVGEVWLCHNTSSSGRTGDLCGGSLQRWEALTDIGSCCHQKQRMEGKVLFRPVDTWVALSVHGNQCDAAILKTRFGQPEVHSYDTCALSNFLLVRKERKVEDGGGLAGKSLLLTAVCSLCGGQKGLVGHSQSSQAPPQPSALPFTLGVTSRFFSMDPWALQSGPGSEASIHSPHLCPPQPCFPPTPPPSPRDQTASGPLPVP